MKKEGNMVEKKTNEDRATGIVVGCGTLIALAFVVPILIVLWKWALR